MSYRAMELAMACARLCPTPVAVNVLFYLAYRHNHKTGQCFPSYERIAEDLGIARSSVGKAIGELEKAGLIAKIQGKRRGSHNSSNRYRLIYMQQAHLRAMKGPRMHAYQALHDSPKSGPDSGRPSSSLRSEKGDARATVRKRSQRRAIKTRMGEDWAPTKVQAAKAVELGLPVERLGITADIFRDWWISVGDVRADWGKAWYNWVRKEVERRNADEERSRNSGTGAGSNQRGGVDAGFSMVDAYRDLADRVGGGDAGSGRPDREE